MKIPIFMIFTFVGVIASWASKALEDGKVSAPEGFELLISLANVLGIPLDFEVKDFLPPEVLEDIKEPVGRGPNLDIVDKVPGK